MKIAYIGKIQLSDIDLSYLHALQQQADATYIMEVCPRYQQGPAFNLKTVYNRSGVFKALDVYPEMNQFADFIDLDKFYVVNTCGRLWPIKAIWTHFLLLVFLIRNRFDAIHLAWPPNLYEFWVYLLRRRLVLTVHDPFPHSGLDSRIVRLRRAVAFALVPRFVLLNRAQSDAFAAYYHISPQRIFLSSLSIYTYLHTIQPDTSCVPKSKYILFFGKISAYKGLDYLLPAMVEVNRHYPDCQLVVAGSGTYPFDLSPYQGLPYLDIRNRFIPDIELVALIQHSEFVVCPYTDATQSGVIMSAFAFDKPVLATRVGGLPEMLHEGSYGVLIEEKNLEALAAGIQHLWGHPQELELYRSRIHTDYAEGDRTWAEIAKEMIQHIYDPIQ